MSRMARRGMDIGTLRKRLRICRQYHRLTGLCNIPQSIKVFLIVDTDDGVDVDVDVDDGVDGSKFK